jgi:nitrate/nitrite transporter NarK
VVAVPAAVVAAAAAVVAAAAALVVAAAAVVAALVWGASVAVLSPHAASSVATKMKNSSKLKRFGLVCIFYLFVFSRQIVLSELLFQTYQTNHRASGKLAGLNRVISWPGQGMVV